MTTNLPRKRSAPKAKLGLESRAADRGHESLLFWVKRSLPTLLKSELQSSRDLNEEILQKKATWRAQIEALISEKRLGTQQAALWRRVPDCQFAAPTVPEPKIVLGVSVASYTADFVAALKVLKWDFYLRDGKETSWPAKPIGEPSDAIHLTAKQAELVIHGAAYTSSTTVGQAAADLAALRSAVEQSLREARYTNAFTVPILLFATDAPQIFDMLIDQCDGVLFDEVGSIVQFRLGITHHRIRSTYFLQ